MSDQVLRHLVSAVATLIIFLGFLAGYISGGHGWWWTAFALLIIYGIAYKIVDAGGGHH